MSCHPVFQDSAACCMAIWPKHPDEPQECHPSCWHSVKTLCQGFAAVCVTFRARHQNVARILSEVRSTCEDAAVTSKWVRSPAESLEPDSKISSPLQLYHASLIHSSSNLSCTKALDWFRIHCHRNAQALYAVPANTLGTSLDAPDAS